MTFVTPLQTKVIELLCRRRGRVMEITLAALSAQLLNDSLVAGRLDFAGSVRRFSREGVNGTGNAFLQIHHCLAIFSRVDCVL